MCFTSRYIPPPPLAFPTRPAPPSPPSFPRPHPPPLSPPPYPHPPLLVRLALPLRPLPLSMDDIAHESLPLHSLPRKRKADSEDSCDSPDIVCPQPPPSLHDLTPNPSKLPAPLSVQTNPSSLCWPPEDAHSATNSPLSPSSDRKSTRLNSSHQ